MARVHLPQSLTALFPGAPRQADVAAATVLEIIEQLNARYPGMRSRLLDPGPALRQHIFVVVDGERAPLTAKVEPESEVRVVAAITGG